MDGLKAEKIALARKKLKEFEQKRRDNGQSPTLSATSSQPVDQADFPHGYHHAEHQNGGRASAVSNYSGHVHQDGYGHQNGVDETVVQISGNPTPSASAAHLDSQNLFYVLQERDQTIQQLSKQLEELNGFYSQLHAAYTELTAQQANNGAGPGVTEQIAHLQAALSGLVAEKTGLQAELRQSRDEYQQIKRELEKMQAELNRAPAGGDVSERELQRLKNVVAERDDLCEKLAQEIETERRESGKFQSQILTIQQDKNEALARLKNIIKDRDSIQAELAKLRKEAQMKDFHLKQYAMHQPGVGAEGGQGHADMEALEKEHEALRSQHLQTTTELGETKEELAGLRSQYNENVSHLKETLESSLNTRYELESRFSNLENELELARQETNKLKEAERQKTPSVAGEQSQPAAPTAGLSENDVLKRIDDAVRRVTSHWEQLLEQNRKESEEMNKEKDRLLYERESMIADLQLKLRLAEENRQVFGDASTELLSLSEQLQAEKATVSRAVAQNRELKEQLIATEDRLIKLTEEKCAGELARQTAEHQARELERRLEGIGSGSSYESTRSTSTTTATSQTDVVTSQPASIIEHESALQQRLQNNRDDEDSDSDGIPSNETSLRQELDETRRQLEGARAELRISNSQNEQMNQILRQNAEDENQNSILVELNQAITRVNALAHENELLREEVETLAQNANRAPVPALPTPPLSSATDLEIEAATARIHQLRSENEDLQEKVHHLTRLLNEADSHLESTRIDENGPVHSTPPASPVHHQNGEHEVVVGSKEWARAELEKRFSEAMRQLAEMQERCDRIEHINQQLQLENETIADHVVLYQHQRRLIRERLRLKDEQMANLEKERERVVSRCNELQRALVRVLDEEKTPNLEPFRPRSYSHSTVDEFSGDEEHLVDGQKDEIPTQTEDSPTAAVHSRASPVGAKPPKTLRETEDNQLPVEYTSREDAVRQIMEIINEIQAPAIPLSSAKMQCKQCIGQMQHL
ncbi:unnamed protein product, partial [Mesorhabditis spiculigera]